MLFDRCGDPRGNRRKEKRHVLAEFGPVVGCASLRYEARRRFSKVGGRGMKSWSVSVNSVVDEKEIISI